MTGLAPCQATSKQPSLSNTLHQLPTSQPVPEHLLNFIYATVFANSRSYLHRPYSRLFGLFVPVHFSFENWTITRIVFFSFTYKAFVFGYTIKYLVLTIDAEERVHQYECRSSIEFTSRQIAWSNNILKAHNGWAPGAVMNQITELISCREYTDVSRYPKNIAITDIVIWS